MSEGLLVKQSPRLRTCGDIPLYTRGTFLFKPPLFGSCCATPREVTRQPYILKPPLCKGRWLAVGETEGLYKTIPQSSHTRRQPPLHKGACNSLCLPWEGGRWSYKSISQLAIADMPPEMLHISPQGGILLSEPPLCRGR